MLTPTQKRAAQAIVNVFETGSARGDYGAVTVLRGDTGHLTYGRTQTTLGSGNLHSLISAYCARPDGWHGNALKPYLAALRARDVALDNDRALRDLLRDCGDDPAMQDEQDAFFDRVYWEPAVRSAEFIGATTALGAAIVYDGRIHGSWHALRDRTSRDFGELAAKGEQAWFSRYVATRKAWLANHDNALLRRTVYRMEVFEQLFAEDKWSLPLPLVVRGVRIDEAVLSGPRAVRASAAPADERVLLLERPFLRGEDVRRLQQALKAAGHDVSADGIFGPGTEKAVIAFQVAKNLTVDGVAGPATLSALGL